MLSRITSFAKSDSTPLSAASPIPVKAGESDMPADTAALSGPDADADDEEDEDEEDDDEEEDDDDDGGGGPVASACICRCIA